MVEVRYLSRNSVLRTISLKELGESGYSPRTFNHAGLPQVVLITYLHFYQVSQPQLLVLFLFYFLSWLRSWMLTNIELLWLPKPVRAQDWRPQYPSYEVYWLACKKLPQSARGLIRPQTFFLFNHDFFLCRFPITKDSNRYRGFQRLLGAYPHDDRKTLLRSEVRITFAVKISRSCSITYYHTQQAPQGRDLADF